MLTILADTFMTAARQDPRERDMRRRAAARAENPLHRARIGTLDLPLKAPTKYKGR